MTCHIYLTLPPNIMRRAREVISRRYPGVRLGSPEIHAEMYAFASTFGDGHIPALSVSAYPQLLPRALALAKQGRLALPEATLPPLRPELAALGLTPPVPELVITAVVPGVLAASATLAAPLRDWPDLCAPGFPGPVGCPPQDTPMPYLLEAVLRGACGPAVQNLLDKLDTRSNPLDINKRIGRGELSAAVLIPAFARTFREGGGRMVWPASGALAVPMLACLGADAPPEAHEILAFLLSEEFQRFTATDGVMAPARGGVPGFAELEEQGWNLSWPGWDLWLCAAENMMTQA